MRFAACTASFTLGKFGLRQNTNPDSSEEAESRSTQPGGGSGTWVMLAFRNILCASECRPVDEMHEGPLNLADDSLLNGCTEDVEADVADGD